MIILTLIQNIALLVTLAAAFEVFTRRFKPGSLIYSLLTGLLFGGAGLVGMLTPLHWAPGIIFDGRSIILSISGLFGGPVAAGVAAIICGAYRLWLGGSGAWVGVSVILESALLGVVFYFLRRRRQSPFGAATLWSIGLLVHVVMLIQFQALPGGAGLDVLRQLGLPILMLYPVAFMLVCLLFQDQESNFQNRTALRESEEKNRKLVEQASDGIFLTDEQGNTLDVNPAGCAMLGYTREEILKLNLNDLHCPDEAPKILEWQAEMRLGKSVISQRCMRRKDGSSLWVETSGRILLNGRFQGVVRDISQRKQSETERTALLEIMQGLAVTKDLQEFLALIHRVVARVIYAENFFVVFYHQETGLFEEIYSVDQYDPPYPPSKLEKSITSYVFRTQQPLILSDKLFNDLQARGEVELVGTDSASWMGAPLLTPGGAIGVVAVQDYENPDRYTERDMEFLASIATQAALAIKRKHDEELLQTAYITSNDIVQAIPSGLFIYRYTAPDQLHLVSGNPAAERLTGLKIGEFAGREFNEIWPAAKESGLTEHYLEVMRSGIAYETDDLFYTDDHISGAYRISAFALPNSCLAVAFENITEHRQAEELLRDSEKKYRLLAENATDVIWLLDFESSRFLYVSPSVENLRGYTSEEVMRQPMHAVFTPDSLALFQSIFPERVAEFGRGVVKTCVDEVEQQCKDGSTVWTEVSTRFAVNEDTGRLEVFGASRNITERKLAEVFLKESEARFKAVSEYSHHAIGLIDESAKIVWVNEAFLELGDYAEEDIYAASSFAEFLAPESLEFVTGNFLKFVRKEEYEHHYSFHFLRRDGQKRLCEKHMTDYEDRTGKRILAISMLDITERRLAELSLQESEERFRQIVERSNDVFYRQNINTGRFEYISPKVFDMLGFTPQEMMQMSVEEQNGSIHSTDLPVVEDFLSQLIMADARGEKNFEREFRVRNKAGKYRWLHGNYSLVRNADGNPSLVVGSLADITTRKQSEEDNARLQSQLLQAQKMESVGRLAGGVAHDFNNWLGVIQGRAETVVAKISPEHELNYDMQEILKAAGRAAELTRQLLAFARKQTASPRVLDVNETIANMLQMLRRLIGENIELAWRPGLDTWHIEMDPSQFDQVLANLLVNARDAISGVGRVVIETSNVVCGDDYNPGDPGFVPGPYCLLTVSDNGSGMNQETLSRLFEPFFTTKEVGKGTGLGLATVYGIVRQNDGFITVYSEPGQGSIFRIYLPRVEGVADAPLPAPELREQRPGGMEMLLMVEDEKSLLEMGVDTLEELGYVVLAANTPAEALRLAKQHAGKIQLLITDVVMPGMNGLELVETLRASLPGLKCLFMSGYTADIITENGVLDEGVHFIQKPFTLNNLAVKVRQALREE